MTNGEIASASMSEAITTRQQVEKLTKMVDQLIVVVDNQMKRIKILEENYVRKTKLPIS